MNRFQMEHVVLSASRITGEKEFVVIGSQAIHGASPNAPGQLSDSMEIDIYPLNKPSKAIEIDGSIGEGTLFESTHGYFAHEVSPETAKLPSQWKQRLVKVSTEFMEDAVALCLSPVDIAFSKLYACREKDIGFVTEMLSHGILKPYQVRKLKKEVKEEEMVIVEKCLAQCELRARSIMFENETQRKIDSLRFEYSKSWRMDLEHKGRREEEFYDKLYKNREAYEQIVCCNKEEALNMLPDNIKSYAQKLDGSGVADLLHTIYREGEDVALKCLKKPVVKRCLHIKKIDSDEEEIGIKI